MEHPRVEEARRVELPDPEVLANALLNLANNYIETGQLGRAEAPLGEVEQWVMSPTSEQQLMLWRYAQHFFYSRGYLRLLRNDADAALNDAAQSLEMAKASRSRKNVIKALRLRGQALELIGRKDAAEPLHQAVRLARGLGNPAQLWRALDAAGNSAGATAVMDRVGAALTDEQLRQTFFSSQEYLRISQRRTG